ncbi:MAG: ABC transporter permease [Acidobacteria bacterium]|nr:ABC transporter permease [Acidobacteriota bacterium]
MSWRWFEDLVQDLRFAVRSLAKHKAFAATAVSTLALGIGANTAIFTVVRGVVLRPLPFAEPDRLVQVYGTPAIRGEAVEHLEEYRGQSESFDALAGYEVSARYLHGSAGAERVRTVAAERGFFSMLGVPPLAGRTFRSGDPATVAVAAEGFWKQRLGGDPSVIGMPVTLDGEPFTIIGVMPDSFQFPYGAASLLPGVASEARTDLWVPLDPPLQRNTRFSHVTGRLKAGIPLRAAESELAVIARRLATQYPDSYGTRGVRLAPLSEAVVARPVRRTLFVLFGAAAIVLALACANVMNLLLVRMTLRSREVAVRAALGAGSVRLVRQFLSESLVLSFAGGVAGLGLAWWGADRLMLLAAAHIPRAHEVSPDWHVFLFFLAACAFTATGFGLAPAILALRTGSQSFQQQPSSHTTMGPASRRLRDGLVVAEVALAFALAVGAAVLIRELIRLRNTDTGMVTRNVVTFHLGQRIRFGVVRRGAPPATDVRQFYEIAERVAGLRGVRAAGFTQVFPLQNWGWSANLSDFVIRGRPATESPPFAVELRYVTPGYFQALGIPIRKGRALTVRDNPDAPRVILINETLERRYFANQDPVGAETTRGTIVGVVGDVRQVTLDRPASPEIYYPIAQNWSQVPELGMTLVVSTQDRPEALADAIRSVIRDVNPNQAVFNVKTMDRVIADSLSGLTLYLSLMALFAALALILASTGIYGVISYVATSRVREFAIRVALGADRGRVTRLVLGQGIRLTAIGLGCGLLGALAATPLLRNLPVSVRPPDIITTAPVAVFLGGVALAACLVRARRVANADPLPALRNE